MSPEETLKLTERLELSVALIKSFVLSGMSNTMNSYNGK
jgi:PTH1 family peptidyl-tRNA hydrolase